MLLTFPAHAKGEWALEMMMFYCKFHQVAIPIAPTVPDVILSVEPIILVSDTWHTAIDFANPFPPMIS